MSVTGTALATKGSNNIKTARTPAGYRRRGIEGSSRWPSIAFHAAAFSKVPPRWG
jgi:hypothetical protein